MNDPKRLLEEGADEFEGYLLRSVQMDAMSSASRQRILTGLGVTGAIVATSATAASTLVAVKAGLFQGAGAAAVKWVAISAFAAAVPTGVWVARSHYAAQHAVERPLPAEVADKKTEETPSKVLAQPVRTAVPVMASPVREPKPTPPSSQPVASATLSDEVAALELARRALADHDPGGALNALDRYKSRYPAGRLAPEAAVVRIEALVQQGDRGQASALADRFELANPRSPYTQRIRSILGRAKTATGGAPAR